jgi:nitrite reductase/ring-hydroxylating ferredoxin subunit
MDSFHDDLAWAVVILRAKADPRATLVPGEDIVSEAKQRRTRVAAFSDLEDGKPTNALVAGVDLVVVRAGPDVSVFYGGCPHRGVLLADGRVDGDRLVCGVHGWSYDRKTGMALRGKVLAGFTSWVDQAADAVLVDEAEVETWQRAHPQKQASAPRDPAVDKRHELRRPQRRGQGCPGDRGRDGGHRDLLRRGRHVARGAGGQLAVFLRVSDVNYFCALTATISVQPPWS